LAAPSLTDYYPIDTGQHATMMRVCGDFQISNVGSPDEAQTVLGLLRAPTYPGHLHLLDARYVPPAAEAQRQRVYQTALLLLVAAAIAAAGIVRRQNEDQRLAA
jgi:hypothetical protein